MRGPWCRQDRNRRLVDGDVPGKPEGWLEKLLRLLESSDHTLQPAQPAIAYEIVLPDAKNMIPLPPKQSADAPITSTVAFDL